jgi:hypothetical protein
MIKLVPIIPKKKFLGDINALERAIEQVLDNAGYDALSLFEDTTRTWKNRPTFYMRKIGAGRSVGTRSNIYKFVDKGTRPHTIRPKRAGGVLRFKAGGFKAKTKPGRIQSFKGSAGQKWISSKGVQHPGTEARGFSKDIGERMQKEITKEMKRAIKGMFK